MSSDGPKNSSHCTDSSESERASPRPMLQKTGSSSQLCRAHHVNRGESSTASFAPKTIGPIPHRSRPPVRERLRAANPFTPRVHKGPACTHTHTHSRFRPMRKQKLHGAVCLASAQAAPHHKQHFRPTANTATRRCFLAQRTECETKTRKKPRTKLRGTHTTAAAATAVPCAGRENVASGAAVIENRARGSKVAKTFIPHAWTASTPIQRPHQKTFLASEPALTTQRQLYTPRCPNGPRGEGHLKLPPSAARSKVGPTALA